jgi:serine/threonine-protein kinase
VDLPTGSSVGGYTLAGTLGSGATRALFLARREGLARDVALLVMHPALAQDPEFRARFEHEAELLCRLSHPNVVEFLDRGQDGDHLWLSMQYVAGDDLAAALRRPDPLTDVAAVQLTEAIGDALDHVHERGLLHRDVRPANILLARQPEGSERALLTGFGIARSMEISHALPRQGTTAETLAYASPEQLGGRPLDRRSDVYSLGAVLFELLTGRRAFGQDDVVALASAVATEPPPDVRTLRPDLPPALAAVFARALHKDPAQRFGTCRELVTAVRAAWPDVAAPRARDRDAGFDLSLPTDIRPAAGPSHSPAAPRSRSRRGGAHGAPSGGSRSRAALVTVLVALLLLVAAAVVAFVVLRDPPPEGLPAEEVAEGAEEALEAEAGARPDVTCPDDLLAEVGAETRCTLRVGGDDAEYGVTVSVRSIENGTTTYDVTVDEEPVE